jgi:hypothetical protein
VTMVTPRGPALPPGVPGVSDVLAALDRAAAAQAEASRLIAEVFGPDGSRVRAGVTGRSGPGVRGGFVSNEGGGSHPVDVVPDDLTELMTPTVHDPTGATSRTVADPDGKGDLCTDLVGAGGVSVGDLCLVLSRVNQVNTGADRIRYVCAELIFAGSEPFIPKPERIHDLLGVRSAEAAVKHYLLTSAKELRDLKTIRTGTGTDATTLAPHPPLLPVLAAAVTTGDLTHGQAQVISALLTPLARRSSGVDTVALDTVEGILVGHATGGRHGITPSTDTTVLPAPGEFGVRMHPEALRHLGKQLAELIDQDGPEPVDELIRRRRSLTLKPGKEPGDPAELHAYLTPEAYEQLTLLLAAILDPKTGPTPEDPTTVGSGGAEGTGGPDAHGQSGTDEPEGEPGADPAAEPQAPFGAGAVEGLFRLPGDGTVTFAQAQHDAFVTLLGLAAKTAPDQGGAPPRIILLARAEQVIKTLTQAPTPAPGDTITDQTQATTDAVAGQVTTAIGTLIDAGRAGWFTDQAITTLNQLITLNNQGRILRDDNPTDSLHNASTDGIDGEHDPGTPRPPGTDAPLPPTPNEPPPVFGASLLQDPRLLTSALLPATGTTIPLTQLGTLLCDAIIDLVTTDHGNFLNYSVAQHRTFTPAQRRALLTTYTTCAVPDCHTPGLRCDAHHIQPASLNGPTTITNGILLCRHHHTKLHQGHLTLHPRQPGLPGLDALTGPV